MSEIPKTPESPPNLENLKPGTWTYILPLYEDDYGVPKPLPAEEVAKAHNEAWKKIANQKGKVVGMFPWATEEVVDTGGVCGPVNRLDLLITIHRP